MRALFVIPKWAEAHPGTGETVLIQLLVDTFHEWGCGEAFILWNDDAFHSRCDIGTLIKSAGSDFHPDVVVYAPIPLPQLDMINVPPDIMHAAGGKVVTFIGDLIDPEVGIILKKYAEVSDLCVNIDGQTEAIGRNFLSLWAPVVKRHRSHKTIDVSFVGSRDRYPDRVEALSHLSAAGVRVATAGGQREKRLSSFDFFEFLNRSLSTLNFSRNRRGLHQVKARVFEAMSCHCCLLEDKNPVTPRYFTPGEEYVEWGTPEELRDKIFWLCGDRTAARRIASAGHERWARDYSAKMFWSRIQATLFS